jgi:pilus assembly protein CpaC
MTGFVDAARAVSRAKTSSWEFAVMKGGRMQNLARKAATLAVLALAGPLFTAGAQAASPSTVAAASQSARADGSIVRQIELAKGKALIVDLPRDAAEVLVGDPNVADAVARSSRRLYIIAKKEGQTTIDAVDGQGRKIETINISVGSVIVHGLGELDRILKTVMPSAHIALHTVSDTIILTGEVDSAEDAQRAYDIASSFVSQANAGSASNANPGINASGNATYDSSGSSSTAPDGKTTAQASFNVSKDGKVINSLTIRGKQQVMLKVTVAEVYRQVLKQLGITSSVASGNWGTWRQDNPLPLNLQTLTTGYAQFGNGSLSATLTAFERDGVARVLAEPTVTAISGEGAKFTAGGEIPVPQNETCSQVVTPLNQCTVGVVFKQYGVTLNFTPVVLSPGRILLHVATEVTEVDPQQSFVFASVNVPGFRTRKNETSVELPSGGSIVSAGLLQVQSQQVINGLPGLMNLPVLGQLFRSRDYQRQETELMIIVTPYIAAPVTANQVPLPTDGFADASDPQTALLGRINRIYASPDNPDLLKNFKGRVGFIDD